MAADNTTPDLTEAERRRFAKKLAPPVDIRLQLAKLIIGALGGVALLAFFLVATHLGVQLGEVERIGIIATAATSFGLALHGAWKTPPAGGGQ